MDLQFLNQIFSVTFCFSILRVTTPILFAALGALISNKAGVINIGLEGLMLISALVGVIVSAYTANVWLGLLLAVLVGILAALILAYVALILKTDVILAGIVLNLIASGGTVALLFLITHDKGVSTSLASKVLPNINLPLIDQIPVLGPILSGHNILTYAAFICVVLISIYIYHTKGGLRLRAVGENPIAAASVGIHVHRVQFFALGLSGALAGLGGAFLSMGYLSWFSANMTAGRGFIALAAEAMGLSTPYGTLAASVFFGIADALSNILQSQQLPSEFVQMFPYLITLLGLILYAANKSKKISKKRLIQTAKSLSKS